MALAPLIEDPAAAHADMIKWIQGHIPVESSAEPIEVRICCLDGEVIHIFVGFTSISKAKSSMKGEGVGDD